MTAQLFSKMKIVRAVKENMARMCSANWKCILSSVMCVWRGGGWGGRKETHGEAGRRNWTQDAPEWALPAGQLKGPFLLIGAASAQAPPSPTAF